MPTPRWTPSRRPIDVALPRAGLYAVTPDLADSADLARRVSLVLAGGVRLVQYRNKAAAPDLKRSQAQMLLALCRAAAVPLIINDDLELMLAIGADGVHLGREDCPGGDLAAVRQRIGPQRLLGVSCYADLERAAYAVAAGADSVAFGAMFSSPTKPEAAPAPLALLAQARQRFGPNVAVAAIGGITLDNIAQVVAAGAHWPAVVSDLFQAPDIAARAAALTRLCANSE